MKGLSLLVEALSLRTDHAHVVCVERLILEADRIGVVDDDRLVHHHALVHVVVEAAHVLQIVDLGAEKSKVVCQHLPIKLLANVLVTIVLVVLFFSRVVRVSIKVNKLVPIAQVGAHVLAVLLAHFEEVLP